MTPPPPPNPDSTIQPLAEPDRFLSEAGAVLASSLDYEVTLERVAHLVVPGLAEYCVIDVLEDDGRLHRRGAAHVDPELEKELSSDQSHAPARGSRSPALRVFETGEAALIPVVGAEWLEAVAQSPEHARLMERLGPRSAIIVPLTARGRTLGILWLAFTEPDREYGPRELIMVEELGRRAGIAVDNARLYRGAQEARGHAERRAREEEALRRAIAAVSGSTSTGEIISTVAESALAATNADGAFVKQVDLDRREAVVRASAGDPAPPLGSRTPYGDSFTRHVVEGETPEVISRLADSEWPLPAGLRERCPDYSALVLPLLDGGEPIGSLVLLRSMEKWGFRQDERERAETFADLASLAFHRIHMFEESERRREELQRVMESRTRLMRGFSHDVKNPLGAADGLLSLLAEGMVGEMSGEQREKLDRARRSIGQALSLTNDLLELARAEAGQIVIKRAPVDVREALRELAEEYRGQARIRQILGNFLSNAVKYTREGGVSAAVELREQGRSEPGISIAATVSDTGPGISREDRRLLFQEFTRFAPDDASGAGIGLAISQTLAYALDGEITVESEPGAGSSFTLWLPVDPRPG